MANYPTPRKPAKVTQLVTGPEMRDAMDDLEPTAGEFELDAGWAEALEDAEGRAGGQEGR